ncbi:MAG: precorrin-2 C(20)-methyltransferase [Microcoleaceae cyanobacterium]
MSSTTIWGTLYGVSVGPGDPELITLKGFNLLKQTPVVAFPAGLHGKPGIAEGIISHLLSPQQQQLSLHFPYVQDDTELTQAWQKAAHRVASYLQQGLDVVFACEGDVSFYSTFTYLAQTLQQLYSEAKVITIPGVCSPLAAVASLGIPLTIRSQKLMILPAIYHIEQLENILKQTDILVLMKVSSVYSQVWEILQQLNLLEQASVVEWATLPQQKIYHGLSDYPQLKLSYFSLMVVQT